MGHVGCKFPFPRTGTKAYYIQLQRFSNIILTLFQNGPIQKKSSHSASNDPLNSMPSPCTKTTLSQATHSPRATVIHSHHGTILKILLHLKNSRTSTSSRHSN